MGATDSRTQADTSAVSTESAYVPEITTPIVRDLDDANVYASDELLESAAAPASPAGNNPWTPLIQAGVDLLTTLANAQNNEAPSTSNFIATDATTGERFLRLPLPSPTDLQRLVESLAQVLRR